MKMNPSFFHHSEIPAVYSHQGLLSKTIIKSVIRGEIERKVVQTG